MYQWFLFTGCRGVGGVEGGVLVDFQCQYATLVGGAKVVDGEEEVGFLTIGNIRICPPSRKEKNHYLPRQKKLWNKNMLFFFNNINQEHHSNWKKELKYTFSKFSKIPVRNTAVQQNEVLRNKYSCSGPPAFKVEVAGWNFPNCSYVINRTCQYPMLVM